MQWSKPVIADLRRERRNASFDIWDLTTLIYGGAEELEKVERMTKLVMGEPRLQTDYLWSCDRNTRYLRACERAETYVRLVRQNQIKFEDRSHLELLMGEDFFILLHDIMFTPSLMNLADAEQQSWWLHKAQDYRIFGTYAQTELTHGSNVRGIKTTATFDPTLYNNDGGWVIDTPGLEATKWWPGGLAKSCNCCILMARVVINGRNMGPHPFFFQVRDWETHETLPGITLLDIGQKLGYNGMDNGAMQISQVSIPRRHLLMRFVNVTPTGEYSRVGNQKMLFGTMTYTRMQIASGCGVQLAKAVTSSIRYSAVRRQFQMQRIIMGSDIDSVEEQTQEDSQVPAVDQLNRLVRPSKRSEAQVLDYSSQQYLLFPQLALSFAMQFAAQDAQAAYQKAIVQFRADDFTSLTEMHVLSSTLKAALTMLCAEGMEQCRKSMGGHGYMNAAGVGMQYLSALPQATYEGDFVVLSIQVGSSIVKTIGRKMMKKKVPSCPTLQYILDFDPTSKPTPVTKQDLPQVFGDHERLLQLLETRANYLHYSAALSFSKVMKKYGASPEALDYVKVDMMQLTYAHAYCLLAKAFLNRLTATKASNPKIYAVLAPLYELLCLVVMHTGFDRGGGFGDFVVSGALEADCMPVILEQIKSLLVRIRPNAVALVDAWNIPDMLLNSCLGRYDGRVYEALMQQTKSEPLNSTDVHDGYYQHLQYALHPERKKAASARSKL